MLLGFDFDGSTKTMWLELVKREKLLAILKGWILLGVRGVVSIPFKEFESVMAKLWHTFTCIPAEVVCYRRATGSSNSVQPSCTYTQTTKSSMQ